MKKWFASGLILLMVMMLAMPAFAAQYATTKDFISVLEENEFVYSYVGIDSDNDEKVTVTFEPDPYDEYRFNFYFNEEGSEVQIRMWNLITVSVDEGTACRTLNDINNNYKWARFVFDATDNTITVKLDVPLSGTDTGDLVLRMMKRAIQILGMEEVETAILSLK